MAGLMTEQAKVSLLRLYEQAKHTSDNFALERIDRALDEIVRLNNSDPAAWQVRSAMANASKVIRGRRRAVSPDSLEALRVDVAVPSDTEDIVELRVWLHGTSGVNEGQRRLLSLLAVGKDAADLAAMHRVPLPRMREQISRARRAARSAYQAEAQVI